MDFVPNFIRFPAVQKNWKSIKIWQSYRQLIGGNFFETQCRMQISLFSSARTSWQPSRPTYEVARINVGLLFIADGDAEISSDCEDWSRARRHGQGTRIRQQWNAADTDGVSVGSDGGSWGQGRTQIFKNVRAIILGYRGHRHAGKCWKDVETNFQPVSRLMHLSDEVH